MGNFNTTHMLLVHKATDPTRQLSHQICDPFGLVELLCPKLMCLFLTPTLVDFVLFFIPTGMAIGHLIKVSYV